jgi:hypothetical protein
MLNQSSVLVPLIQSECSLRISFRIFLLWLIYMYVVLGAFDNTYSLPTLSLQDESGLFFVLQ